MERLSKIRYLGSMYAKHVLDSPVEITGKYDGSQFRIYKESENSLVYGSRNAEETDENFHKEFFQPAIDYANEHKEEILKNMPTGATMFTEYVGKGNHHRIKYDQKVELIVFNFFYDGFWRPPDWIKSPFPIVKIIRRGEVTSRDCVDILNEINLHKDKLEGIVIKNYSVDFPELLSERFAKLVLPEFKETESKMFPLDKKETKKEQKFLNLTLTRTRVEKLLWYLKENDPEFDLSMSIMRKLVPLVFEDILREELVDWLLKKKPDVFHFKELRKAIGGKVAHLLGLIIHDWLKNEV